MGSRFLTAAIAAALIFPGLTSAGRAQVVLGSFSGANGSSPEGLILSNGNLYGTAGGGGANNDGTVFSLPVTGGTPTALTSFNGLNGRVPNPGLTLSGGILYGTTQRGGANNPDLGTVFSLPVTGGTPTVLTSFDVTHGQFPNSGVTVSGNTLYGTTFSGPIFQQDQGTVFSLPVSGGTPAVLAAVGGNPTNGLTLSGDTLYGTTSGRVFSMSVFGGTPIFLATFDGTHGTSPVGSLTLSGNTLYGMTNTGGGNNLGVVYSVPVTGGTPTVLANFDGAHGANPLAGLLLSGDTLYGTTYIGGANNDGVVFSLPVTGGIPTVLASFDVTHGRLPNSDLVLSNGILYGTTQQGGDFGDGVVFAVAVPEPGTLALLVGAGAGGWLLMRLRRRIQPPGQRPGALRTCLSNPPPVTDRGLNTISP